METNGVLWNIELSLPGSLPDVFNVDTKQTPESQITIFHIEKCTAESPYPCVHQFIAVATERNTVDKTVKIMFILCLSGSKFRATILYQPDLQR